MNIVRRIIKICSVIILGVAATGCIVLPYGGHHGRRDRGDQDYSGPSDRQSDQQQGQRDRQDRGRR